jgi:hypothetical protein
MLSRDHAWNFLARKGEQLYVWKSDAGEDGNKFLRDAASTILS